MDRYDHYNASLLIVDDHDGVRGAVRDWLAVSFPGLRIQEAPDAEQALRAVEGARFDIVLMDIGLPGINGVEATRRLRQCAPQAKVVMISVHDSDAQRAAAREAGAVGFVAKRCMHEGLLAALGPLLAETRAPDSAGERET